MVSQLYLQSRYQVVKIHNAISDQVTVTCGVPQGSILGLFTSLPIPQLSQCYVDDTKSILNFNLQDQANAIAKSNEDMQNLKTAPYKT